MLPAGMLVSSFSGTAGQISVPGLGAVVATFHRWTLKRPEEIASVEPKWTLQAVLSYQNSSLLLNDNIQKMFTLELNKTTKIKICDYESMQLEGASLLVEGVIQCQ